ncbi:DUF6318 family protein [Cellulomonas cellasea]|uniref:DUF6318 family protein n=1 Tax=Cellulomonas cellasea TaxID=43670 RepID=UPI0025A33D45|nr:DUF6318 family protein [Cellulomonas cellasea]MDM8085065.1 DUF6318 family protein [Cellulomonas cellasea]
MATALVLAAPLGLTACTGSSGRDPSPSPTATGVAATPDPTPTAPSTSRSSKPERPAAMDSFDIEGAIAAATYITALYPYVYNTGDLTEWKTLSHPECIFCTSVVEGVEELHGQGFHNEGGQILVEGATAVELNPGRSFSADLSLRQGPATVVDSSGNQVGEPSQEVSSGMTFILFIDQGNWQIREAETKPHEE